MKITFACTGCGRTLKARPDSVGRTRKCPVCATRVTCPARAVRARPVEAEVLDADIVEAEVVVAPPRAAIAAGRGAPAPEPAPAFDPYADVDDDPYQLAEPDPATMSPPEVKRPCPMCGEMILASAVKCRFCGEVFDDTLKKGESRKKRRKSSGGGSSSAGSRDIGIGILCMLAGIVMTILSFAYASGGDNGGGKFFVFYGLVIGGFIQMCRGLVNLIRS